MTKHTFQYSLLRYRHSYFLGEEVNVGILLYFPDKERVDFLYPNYLERISNLYPDFTIHSLRKYLKAFGKQAQKVTEQLSGSSNLFNGPNFQAIIEDFFLTKDATALFFSDSREGTYEDVYQTLTYYKEQYLSVYEKPAKRDHKDEGYIRNKITEGLRALNIINSKKVKRNYTLETPYLSQTFDYAWENGRTNLITPIGFDLKREESIESKGCTWRGRLDTLQAKAFEENLRFDLIVSQPTDRSLFKTYDNVLKILDQNKAPKEVIEVDEVNRYLEEIA
jgi:hypothetical protein